MMVIGWWRWCRRWRDDDDYGGGDGDDDDDDGDGDGDDDDDDDDDNADDDDGKDCDDNAAQTGPYLASEVRRSSNSFSSRKEKTRGEMLGLGVRWNAATESHKCAHNAAELKTAANMAANETNMAQYRTKWVDTCVDALIFTIFKHIISDTHHIDDPQANISSVIHIT